jgi:ribosomal protein L11 methyltransferase
MTYSELTVYTSQKKLQDIFVSELADIGFESFVNEKDLLKAYIPSDNLNEEAVIDLINQYIKDENALKYEIQHIEENNWNEAWESSFEPIEIDDKIYIRAPFHSARKGVQFDIVISPKMSFGTGHHATTQLMCKAMLEMDLKGKKVLDMGCGTGILAILAMKLGAESADAVDTEEWAVENTLENANINETIVQAILADSKQFDSSSTYDVVFANINRNIIVRDLGNYVKLMKSNSEILMSGFLTVDEPIIQENAIIFNLKLEQKNNIDEWLMMHFKKG